MNKKEIEAKFHELMKPITQQVLMCDSKSDLLMLTSCLLVVAKNILDEQVGTRARVEVFKEFSK